MKSDSTHPLDEQLTALLYRLGGCTPDENPHLKTLIHTLSAHVRDGIVAVPRVSFPSLDWSQILPLSVIGREGEYAPIIVNDTHVWLFRYWFYEQRLACAIHQRLGKKVVLPPQTDLQQHAIDGALSYPFYIISGGPGTGKTTTVTRLLKALFERNPELTSHDIALAAPTGKAAMRMLEAIRDTSRRLQFPPEILEKLPESAKTLHRLLGFNPRKAQFKRAADDPIHAKVLIVDEASMIDISLMTHLLEAVHPDTKLILLGDKQQLASVEAGSVFRDLCDSEVLSDYQTLLVKSHRFDKTSDVGQLAAAIQQGDEVRFFEVLDSAAHPNVTLLDDSHLSLDKAWLLQCWSDYFNAVRQNHVEDAFKYFNALKILTPLRKGKLGVESLNQWLDSVMRQHLPVSQHERDPAWYAGRPILITHNDYERNLLNGDIGLTLLDENQNLKVWFAQSKAGEFRAISPVRLPSYEAAWAMTIHKSQGSEFERVLLLLPNNEALPLLGRELLYTAVTRAKTEVTIMSSRGILALTLQRFMQSASAIGGALAHVTEVSQ